MKNFLNIPEGVSPHLVHELSGIQDQIIILINNHKILTDRANQDPNNADITQQIEIVENYLVEFGTKQEPLIAKIREEIKSLTLKRSDSGSTSVDLDDKSSSMDTNDSRDIPATKVSMKDRMALVRQQKKRKKKKRAIGSSGRPTRTPTPEGEYFHEADDDASVDVPTTQAELEAKGMFRAHIDEVPKISFEDSLPKSFDERISSNNPVRPEQKTLNQADQRDFLLNLSLLNDVDAAKLEEFTKSNRKRAAERRNFTYIPEFTEKKQRTSYCWLSSELASPPLLRTSRGGTVVPAVYERMKTRNRKNSTSASNNSRSSTPPLDDVDDKAAAASIVENVAIEKKPEEDSGNESNAMEVVHDEIADELLEPKLEEAEPVSTQVEPEDIHAEDRTTASQNVTRHSESSPIVEQPSQPLSRQTSTPQRVLPERRRTLTEKQREKTLKNKVTAEKQLAKLDGRKKEIEDALNSMGCSKFTVATRKERVRQGELQSELDTLNEKRDKLATIIQQYNQQL